MNRIDVESIPELKAIYGRSMKLEDVDSVLLTDEYKKDYATSLTLVKLCFKKLTNHKRNDFVASINEIIRNCKLNVNDTMFIEQLTKNVCLEEAKYDLDLIIPFVNEEDNGKKFKAMNQFQNIPVIASENACITLLEKNGIVTTYKAIKLLMRMYQY